MTLRQPCRVGETPARGNAFDFLRLVAALSVLVQHSVIHLDASFLWFSPSGGAWFWGGVSVFFVLSGMMVYRSAERCYESGQPWRNFFLNRALRIMPAMYVYLIGVVVVLLLVGALTVGELGSPGFLGFVASTIFLVPVFHTELFSDFGVGVVNGSIWTIPVEVSFYLLVPLLVLFAAKSGWRTMITTTFVVSIAGLILEAAFGGYGTENMIGKLLQISFLPHLILFALGMFWGKMWSRTPQSGWIAAVCVVAYFTLRGIPLSGPWAALVTSGLSSVPMSYAAIWFGFNGPKALWRISEKIGDLSFSTYIWHMIVVNVLILWGAREWSLPGTLLVLLVAAVAMLISAASWWFVERPALHLKRYSSANSVVRR